MASRRSLRCRRRLVKAQHIYFQMITGMISPRPILRIFSLLLGVASLVLAIPIAAQTVVTNSADSGPGSLREAIATPSPGLITFATELSGGTITLTSGQLVIAQDLTIDASALAVAFIIDADQNSRVFYVQAGRTVALHNLELTGGWVDDRSDLNNGLGGCISNQGTLTIANTIIRSNRAVWGAGIGNNGGSIVLNHSSIIDNSTLTNNNDGGGIWSRGGSVTLNESTISSNAARQGGGIWNSGGIVTLNSSTFTDNSASAQNLASGGGGIFSTGGTVRVNDSTFSGNSARDVGGGILGRLGHCIITNSTFFDNSAGFGGGIVSSGDSLTVNNSTISDNSAGTSGGGILASNWDDLLGTFASGQLRLTNSIVAGNSAGTIGPDLRTESNPVFYTFVGNNLIGDNSGSSAEAVPGLVGTGDNPIDPLISPPGDFGGPTSTMIPIPGSPAIDSASGENPTLDQRGLPREAMPDIGATEFQASSDLLFALSLFWDIDHDGDGNSFSLETALGTDPFKSDLSSARNLQMLPGGGDTTFTFGIVDGISGIGGIIRLELSRSTNTLSDFQPIASEVDFSDIHNGIVTFSDPDPPIGAAFYRLETTLK